ncbi:hypothetical protein CLCR_05079 [Cladophialophora carrionii]|uniref:Uncharacterized protein n=1 Tax=Cladophialophora carrionii TaxID=86049 RepID=A0A1C1CKT8_9EURO|nr:hypothetical protein CLCR_05079 [Cladophialophora carrionii]
MTSSVRRTLVIGLMLATMVLGQDCGRRVVFTDRGASSNYYNCSGYVDGDMWKYLAWYNGTTTVTLTGGPMSECPDTTWQPLQNSFLIGGMTVPGNASLDRRAYDNNTFYFEIPSKDNDNITVSFQSSSDEWYDEPQGWQLNATKKGDGYDVAGTWIGTLPDNNELDFPGVPGDDCWYGGPYYLGMKGYDNMKWVLEGHVSPTAAEISIIETNIDRDGGVWHIYTNFTGKAGPKGPKLVTAGAAPTTDAKA